MYPSIFDRKDIDANCTMSLLQTLRYVKNQMDAKASQDNRLGADMYAVTIIGAFASIIILLMFRSIRPHQSLDEQVVLMMSTMKMRVEVDEMERRKLKMREAKQRAQDWINRVKTRSIRSFSRSSRRSKVSVDTPPSLINDYATFKFGKKVNNLPVPFTQSQQILPIDYDTTQSQASNSTRQSVCSAPTPHFLEVNLPVRSSSHLGFVPEIVVTEERPKHLLFPPPRQKRRSMVPEIKKSTSCQILPFRQRQSSMSSNISVSPSLTEEILFNFPDTFTPNDSPPYDI